MKLARLEEKRTGYVAENTRIQLRQAIDQAFLNMTTAWDKYKVTGVGKTAVEVRLIGGNSRTRV